MKRPAETTVVKLKPASVIRREAHDFLCWRRSTLDNPHRRLANPAQRESAFPVIVQSASV